MVGRALQGEAMAKQGYLREKHWEPLEWSSYTPGECMFCKGECAIVRWHSPNHEKPARLPDGNSMHTP